MTYPAEVHGTLRVVYNKYPTKAFEPTYNVTFEMYDASIGQKSRSFSTEETVIHFLQVDLGIIPEAVERMLSDLRRKGTAQILDLELAREDLGRVGFA